MDAESKEIARALESRDTAELEAQNRAFAQYVGEYKQLSLVPEAMRVLSLFRESRDPNEIASPSFQEIAHLLLDAKVLIPAEDPPRPAAWAAWGQAAYYYHFTSRKQEGQRFKYWRDESKQLEEKNSTEPFQPNYLRGGSRVPLPDPLHLEDGQSDGPSFYETLFRRQSIRSFNVNREIKLSQLSTLLFLVFGNLSCFNPRYKADIPDIGAGRFKSSPTGGGRTTTEAYVCSLNVADLAPGVYHYYAEEHFLELVQDGNFRPKLAHMCGDQACASLPAALIFYTATLDRMAWKYTDPRSYRNIFIEAGHFSQTLFLTAAWLGLGAFFLGALRDEEVEEFLQISPEREIPIGVSGIGALEEETRLFGRAVRNDLELWDLSYNRGSYI